MCIANHYAELRHIPSSNFLFLDWDPKQETTDVDTFRDKILLPVLRAAKHPIAGLQIPGRQIDYVVYSSDFPWGIRIDDDLKRFKDLLEKQEKGKKEEKPQEQGRKKEKPAAKPSDPTKYFTPVAALSMSIRKAIGMPAPERPNRPRKRRWGFPASRPTVPMARREPVRDATTCCR